MKTIDPKDSTFLCPITGELMLEPVVDHEGNTYEKAAIIEWLREHDTSPITRNPLSIDQLAPNRALQSLIETSSSASMSTVPSSPSSSTGSEKDNNEPPPEPQLSLEAFTRKDGISTVRIHIEDDATKLHVPSTVICVIDVSYSMDDAATMHNDSEGSSGLSLLDVVKHATRTIIEILGPQDTLAIITYADSAKTELPFTNMTPENRIKATQTVEGLQTCGSTNLWDGLLKAMDLAGNSNNATIFLLTDGLPNIHPPRGELPSLIRYKERNPDMKCRISTFGFGYNLDSTLLNDIAMEGNGLYSFIPDSSFVGTVFINAVCGVLSTALLSSTLSIELNDGVKLDETYELGHNFKATSWGLSVSLPSLSYGQVFDVIFKLDEKTVRGDGLTFSASIGSSGAGGATFHAPEPIDATFVGHHYDSEQQHAVLIHVAETRKSLISLIRTAEGRFKSNDPKARCLVQTDIESATKAMDTILQTHSDNECLVAMKKDLVGQVAEAYSRQEWHKKWGRHYLPSLARAHELQQCTNFKDPGLQLYATSKFALLRDSAEDVFCKLPPPKASRANQVKNFQPTRTMRSMHNSSNPCFAAGNVRLSDGRNVPVNRIVAGDKVHTGQEVNGRPVVVEVVCVVVTDCAETTQDLVELEGGVLVTPWHPVRRRGSSSLDGSWKFPADLGMTRSYTCEQVYSFVLEQGASFFQIGPLEAVSLGHGIENDEVATHHYLGTNKVKEDLSRMQGWNDGLVKLGVNPGVRDPQSGLIIRFEQQQQQHRQQKILFLSHETTPQSNGAFMVNEFPMMQTRSGRISVP